MDSHDWTLGLHHLDHLAAGRSRLRMPELSMIKLIIVAAFDWNGGGRRDGRQSVFGR